MTDFGICLSTDLRYKLYHNKTSSADVFKVKFDLTTIGCAMECKATQDCVAANHGAFDKSCEMLAQVDYYSISTLPDASGWTYIVSYQGSVAIDCIFSYKIADHVHIVFRVHMMFSDVNF